MGIVSGLTGFIPSSNRPLRLPFKLCVLILYGLLQQETICNLETKFVICLTMSDLSFIFFITVPVDAQAFDN